MSHKSHIHVYVTYNKKNKHEKGMAHLKGLFERPAFRLHMLGYEDKSQADGKLDTPDVMERKVIINALNHCHTNFPQNACIIVRDSTACNIHGDRLNQILIDALQQGGDFDVMMLNKWGADCDNFSDHKELNGRVFVVRTRSAYGLHAIMFTPRGRQILLGAVEGRRGHVMNFTGSQNLSFDINKAIGSGDLVALCTPDNLMSIDPAAVKGHEYKLQNCAPGTGSGILPGVPTPTPAAAGALAGSGAGAVVPIAAPAAPAAVAPVDIAAKTSSWNPMTILLIALVILGLILFWRYKKQNQAVPAIEQPGFL